LSPYLDGTEVELDGALPLGIVDGGRFEAKRFELRPGSRLTFYSDGVVEAQNKKGELFGFDRAKAISTKPAAAIVDAAIAFGQEDDITVMTIERLNNDRAADSPSIAPIMAPA
jgi:serine phosphatase RsbU (regulator of sigma subunit)